MNKKYIKERTLVDGQQVRAAKLNDGFDITISYHNVSNNTCMIYMLFYQLNFHKEHLKCIWLSYIFWKYVFLTVFGLVLRKISW